MEGNQLLAAVLVGECPVEALADWVAERVGSQPSEGVRVVGGWDVLDVFASWTVADRWAVFLTDRKVGRRDGYTERTARALVEFLRECLSSDRRAKAAAPTNQ